MFLLTRLRAILQKYKQEVLLGLLAAGCITIGYITLKDRAIHVNLKTFEELVQSDAVKEVIVKGNEI